MRPRKAAFGAQSPVIRSGFATAVALAFLGCGGSTTRHPAHTGDRSARAARRPPVIVLPEGRRAVHIVLRGTVPEGIQELAATGTVTVARSAGNYDVTIALEGAELRLNGLEVPPAARLPAFRVSYSLDADGALRGAPEITPLPSAQDARRLVRELASALVEPVVSVPARARQPARWSDSRPRSERLDDVDMSGTVTIAWEERRDAVREDGPVRAFAGNVRFAPAQSSDEQVRVEGGVGLEVLVLPSDGRGHMRLGSFAARGRRGDEVLRRLSESLVVWAPIGEGVTVESLRHNPPAPQTLALCMPVLDDVRTRVNAMPVVHLLPAADAPSASLGGVGLATELGVHVVAQRTADGAVHLGIAGGEECSASEISARALADAARQGIGPPGAALGPARGARIAYVDADAELPVSALAGPLRDLARENFELRLVVHTSLASEVPAAVREGRPARPDRSTWDAYVAVLQGAAPECPAWTEASGLLGAAAADERPAMVGRLVREAYARCGCLGAPDPEVGIGLAQVLSGAEWSLVRWLPLRVAVARRGAPRARPLALPRRATVADLAHAIEARPEAEREAVFTLPVR